MKISVFPDVTKITNPPTVTDSNVVLERIKNGRGGLAELVGKIRQEKAVGARTALKKQLGCVIFSGVCGNGVEKVSKSTGRKYTSYRDDKSLTEHSGLCIVDLDHLGDDKDVELWKSKFAVIPSVYAAFKSPSGDGLKVLFRIPPDLGKHRGHYRALMTYIRGEYKTLTSRNIDNTSINEARVCFISYDPDLYVNPDAVEFTDYEEIEHVELLDDAAIKTGNGLTDYEKLQVAAKMIDMSKDGFKHHTLMKAAYLMGGYITGGYVNEAEARNMLRQRIAAKNPQDLEGAYKSIDDGIREGKRKPIYEIEEIEKEFEVEVLRKQFHDEQRGYTFLVDRTAVDDKLMDYIVNGAVEGLKVGLPEVDEFFRYKENNFTVFLGHDNVGKSTLVWWLTVVASVKHGWKWIIYSPENDTAKTKKQLMDFVIGRKCEDSTPKMIELAKVLIDEHFYFIRKDEIFNVFQVLEYGRVLCEQDKAIKGFMIDPYNSLALDYRNKGAGLSGYEYHMRAISEMRVFAEKYCSVYVNAHSTTDSRRAGKPDGDGRTARPHKAEIDGGAMWANRCDDFYVIHRHLKSEELWRYTELHVDKIKDTDTGGRVTRGDEYSSLQFINNADFVAEGGSTSPLKEWRRYYFGEGKQATMQAALDDSEEHEEVPF